MSSSQSGYSLSDLPAATPPRTTSSSNPKRSNTPSHIQTQQASLPRSLQVDGGGGVAGGGGSGYRVYDAIMNEDDGENGNGRDVRDVYADDRDRDRTPVHPTFGGVEEGGQGRERYLGSSGVNVR